LLLEKKWDKLVEELKLYRDKNLKEFVKRIENIKGDVRRAIFEVYLEKAIYKYGVAFS
jgi:hypothetical protein